MQTEPRASAQRPVLSGLHSNQGAGQTGLRKAAWPLLGFAFSQSLSATGDDHKVRLKGTWEGKENEACVLLQGFFVVAKEGPEDFSYTHSHTHSLSQRQGCILSVFAEVLLGGPREVDQEISQALNDFESLTKSFPAQYLFDI